MSEHFSWSSGSLRLDEVAFLKVSVRLITPVWCGVWSPPEADGSSQMGACEDAISATYLQGLPWGHCVHWDAFHCSDPRKKAPIGCCTRRVQGPLASDVGVWDLVPLISQLLDPHALASFTSSLDGKSNPHPPFLQVPLLPIKERVSLL